jgi:hypothetical protein
MPRPALDRHGRDQRPPAGPPDGQPGRLGDDHAVAAHAVGDRRKAAGAGRLLVGHGAHGEVAAQHAEPGDRLGGDHHGGDAALHVAGAAPVHPAVAEGRAVGRGRPAAARLDVDHVDVAVQDQVPPVPLPGEPGRQLRSALEADRLRHHRRSTGVAGRRLPEVYLRSRSRQPGCQQLLQKPLLAGRVRRPCPGRRVERYQRLEQLEQLAGPPVDVLTDRSLVVPDDHRAKHDTPPPPAAQSTGRGYLSPAAR